MPARRHSDDILFCVYALFLKGHSEATVAAFMKLTVKQVSGIINRSPYRGRAGMPDSDRQRHLTNLKTIHFDRQANRLRCGGRLERFDFDIQPLAGDQRPGRKKS